MTLYRITPERAQEIAAEVHECFEQAKRETAEDARRWDAAAKQRPRVFTHAERRAYFVNAGTSVPEQLRPPSLSVRLTWAVVKGVYRAIVWTDSKLRGRK